MMLCSATIQEAVTDTEFVLLDADSDAVRGLSCGLSSLLGLVMSDLQRLQTDNVVVDLSELMPEWPAAARTLREGSGLNHSAEIAVYPLHSLPWQLRTRNRVGVGSSWSAGQVNGMRCRAQMRLFPRGNLGGYTGRSPALTDSQVDDSIVCRVLVITMGTWSGPPS